MKLNTLKQIVAALDAVAHDPKNGQFTSGGGGGEASEAGGKSVSKKDYAYYEQLGKRHDAAVKKVHELSKKRNIPASHPAVLKMHDLAKQRETMRNLHNKPGGIFEKDVTKDSSPCQQIALDSLIEELDAIAKYKERIAACDNEALCAVLKHNLSEEIKHANGLLDWLMSQQAD